MSSSDPDSKIDFLDPPEVVRRKIKGAFCEEGNTAENGVLAFVNAVLIPISQLRLERLADFLLCHPRSTLSWRGREHHALRTSSERLDVCMLAGAYGTTLSPAFLAAAAPACCADLRAASVAHVFARVHALHTRHWGPRHTPLLSPHRLAGTVWADVLLALLTVDPARRGAEWRSALADVDRYLCFAGAPEDVAQSDALLATLARAALHHEELGDDDMPFRVLKQILVWSDMGQVRLGEAVRLGECPLPSCAHSVFTSSCSCRGRGTASLRPCACDGPYFSFAQRSGRRPSARALPLDIARPPALHRAYHAGKRVPRGRRADPRERAAHARTPRRAA